MIFDPKFALDILLPINTAAYQLSWNQKLTLPPGWEHVANITVDQSLMDRQTAAGLAKIAISENCNWGVAARKDDTAVLAIRGTETHHQWLEDFDALAVPTSYRGWWTHHGFLEIYTSVADSIRKANQAVSSASRIFIVGHSLGAALALLAGVELGNPNTWTFAGPRVFAQGARFDCYRVVNHWDIVPNVPLPPLYDHVGTAINIDSGFTLDAGVAHMLDTGYVPGLKKLLGASAVA